MSGARYPENESFLRAQLTQHYERFAELREDFLLDYGYNTARAYWSDLQHLLEWTLQTKRDVLMLSDQDIRNYLRTLKRKGYSPNTIRRRMTTVRAFTDVVSASASPHDSVTSSASVQ